MGDSTEPEWPDFEGFGQLIGKFFQWVVILAVCFGPASFLGFKMLSDEDGMPGATGLIAMAVLYIAGASYFPMALLGVAVFDTLGALNPMLVARSIFKVPGHYFVVLLIFGGLLGCSLLVSMLTLYVPIIGTMLYQFYSLWGLMFLAKILGGLYAVNSQKLGWI